LIESIDIAGAQHELTAEYVREVAMRIIHMDEHDTAHCSCDDCARERTRITAITQQRAEEQEGCA
jgi:hypothetical protein